MFKVAAKFCSVSGPAVFQENLEDNFFPVLAKVFFQNCWRDFEKIWKDSKQKETTTEQNKARQDETKKWLDYPRFLSHTHTFIFIFLHIYKIFLWPADSKC